MIEMLHRPAHCLLPVLLFSALLSPSTRSIRVINPDQSENDHPLQKISLALRAFYATGYRSVCVGNLPLTCALLGQRLHACVAVEGHM